MAKSPAYQMYARDWLASRSVRFMEDYQRGWYIQLLNEAWDSDPQCMLPDDDEILQRMAGVSAVSRAIPDFNDRWTTVRRMFKQHGQYVCNERQMEEYASQQLRRDQAVAAGKSSAAKRAEALKIIKDKHFADSTTVERPLNDRCQSVQRESNTATATAPASAPAIAVCGLQDSPAGKRASKPALASGFGEFWAAYPSKVGKAAAEKAWTRIHADEDLATTILASIETQKGWRNWREGFIPNPATWLNQRRWEDEGTEAAAAPRRLNKAEQLHEDNQRSLQIVLERMAARGMEVQQDD